MMPPATVFHATDSVHDRVFSTLRANRFAEDLAARLGCRVVDVVSLKKLAPRPRAQVEAEAVRVA
jgi:hypothetical protein